MSGSNLEWENGVSGRRKSVRGYSGSWMCVVFMTIGSVPLFAFNTLPNGSCDASVAHGRCASELNSAPLFAPSGK